MTHLTEEIEQLTLQGPDIELPGAIDNGPLKPAPRS